MGSRQPLIANYFSRVLLSANGWPKQLALLLNILKEEREEEFHMKSVFGKRNIETHFSVSSFPIVGPKHTQDVPAKRVLPSINRNNILKALFPPGPRIF